MKPSVQVQAVEKILKYSFRNKCLLREALTHSSIPEFVSYERLEFIGDAALGLAFSKYIFMTYPELNEGQLTLMRTANVSNEKLARVAIRLGLYSEVRRSNVDALDEKVREFAKALKEEEDEDVMYGGSLKAPKILADIVESVAGAIYVDTDFDLQRLWEILGGLLEPIITLKDLQQHPMSMLYAQCQKQGKQVDIKCCEEGTKNIISVYVNGEFVSSGSSKQIKIAKLNAAKEALRELFPDASLNVGVMGICGELDGAFEIGGAKQKLNELCAKKKWPKPGYRIRDSGGQENLNGDDAHLGRTRLGSVEREAEVIVRAGGRQALEKPNSVIKNFCMKIFLLLLGFGAASELALILGHKEDWDDMVKRIVAGIMVLLVAYIVVLLVAGIVSIVVAAIVGIGMLVYRTLVCLLEGCHHLWPR